MQEEKIYETLPLERYPKGTQEKKKEANQNELQRQKCQEVKKQEFSKRKKFVDSLPPLFLEIEPEQYKEFVRQLKKKALK